MFWAKNKFLIIFIAFLVGAPFLITKFSETFFQEASTITSNTSVCLDTNPPTVWIEKGEQSRKGYAPSGVKHTEIMDLNMINCGEINLQGISFKISSSKADEILNGGMFKISFLGTDFFSEPMIEISKDEIMVNFKFEQIINISLMGANNKIKLFGTLPNEYSGKTIFSVDSINLTDNSFSKVEINNAKSTLVFVKKE